MVNSLRLSYPAPYSVRLATLCVLVLVFLTACSGVGVVATSDPERKLAQAEEMISSGRIGQARRLMDEAAELYTASGDQMGLAEAYRQTAFLIRIYGEGALLAPPNPQVTTLDTVTADKSNGFFERAVAIQRSLNDYGLVSHLKYNIGVNYALSDRPREACSSFDESLAAFATEKRRRPEHDPQLPPGIASFEEFIDQAKMEAGCV